MVTQQELSILITAQNQANAAMAETIAGLDNITLALTRQNAISTITNSMLEVMSGQLMILEAQGVRAQGGVEKFAAATEHAGAKAHEAEGGLGVFTAAVEHMQSIALGFAEGELIVKGMEAIQEAIPHAVEAVEKFGEETINVMHVTGMTAESSSELIGTFERFGVSGDQAATLLTRFAKNLQGVKDETDGSAAAGKGLTQVLDEMGVKAHTAEGSTRPMLDVLLDMADKFREMPDGADKTAAAIAAFGRTGAQLIPVLDQGREGVTQLMAESQRLGYVLTTDNVEAIHRAILAHREMDAAMQGLQLTMATKFLPEIKDMAIGVDVVAVALNEKLVPALRGTRGEMEKAHDISIVQKFWQGVDAELRTGVANFEGAFGVIRGVADRDLNEIQAAWSKWRTDLAGINDAVVEDFASANDRMARQAEAGGEAAGDAYGSGLRGATEKTITQFQRRWEDFFAQNEKRASDYSNRLKDDEDAFDDHVKTKREELSKHLADLNSQELTLWTDYNDRLKKVNDDFNKKTTSDKQESVKLEKAISLDLTEDMTRAATDAERQQMIVKKKGIDDRLKAETDAHNTEVGQLYDGTLKRQQELEKRKKDDTDAAQHEIDVYTDAYNKRMQKAYDAYKYETEQSAVAKARLTEDTTAAGLKYEETSGKVQALAKAIDDTTAHSKAMKDAVVADLDEVGRHADDLAPKLAPFLNTLGPGMGTRAGGSGSGVAGLSAAPPTYGAFGYGSSEDLAKIFAENNPDLFPHFAGGGVATSPTLALVAESEPELIMPISKLQPLLDQLSSSLGVQNISVKGGGGLADAPDFGFGGVAAKAGAFSSQAVGAAAAGIEGEVKEGADRAKQAIIDKYDKERETIAANLAKETAAVDARYGGEKAKVEEAGLKRIMALQEEINKIEASGKGELEKQQAIVAAQSKATTENVAAWSKWQDAYTKALDAVKTKQEDALATLGDKQAEDIGKLQDALSKMVAAIDAQAKAAAGAPVHAAGGPAGIFQYNPGGGQVLHSGGGVAPRGGHWDWSGPGPGARWVPEMAEGGIVTSPTLAMVGEKGPEAVVPLGKGGGMGGDIHIHFNGGVHVGSEEDFRRAVETAVVSAYANNGLGIRLRTYGQ